MMDICDEIIAFEPHPYTAKRCQMNFLLNNKSKSSIQQLALSNESGKIYFSDYGGSSTVNHIIEGTHGIEINVTTLDSFIIENKFSKDKLYVIKVDVEGFEQKVFEGGKHFLTNYNVAGIVFERFSKDGVFSILKSYGYEDIKKISENNYLAKKVYIYK
jgi:FkbM family methyltransferase